MQLKETAEKYFKDEKRIYYNVADIIQKDNYMSYRINGGYLILTVGSDDGEVDIAAFGYGQDEQLKNMIETLLYEGLSAIVVTE